MSILGRLTSSIKSDDTKQTEPVQQQQNSQPAARQYLNNIQYDSRTLGINTDSDIEKLKNTFRGRRLSSDGMKFEGFDGGEQLISEAGAETLLSVHANMLSISNATTFIEHSDDIKDLCREYAQNILENVLAKSYKWEIDEDFYDTIIDSLTSSYRLFLQKCLGDKQRRHMHGGIQNEPTQQQNPLTPMPP